MPSADHGTANFDKSVPPPRDCGFPYDLGLKIAPFAGQKPASKIRLTEFTVLLPFEP